MRSTVPREAVRLDENKKFVYQIVNDELHRRDIQTAISNLTEVEVTGGLTERSCWPWLPPTPSHCVMDLRLR